MQTNNGTEVGQVRLRAEVYAKMFNSFNASMGELLARSRTKIRSVGIDLNGYTIKFTNSHGKKMVRNWKHDENPVVRTIKQTIVVPKKGAKGKGKQEATDKPVKSRRRISARVTRI